MIILSIKDTYKMMKFHNYEKKSDSYIPNSNLCSYLYYLSLFTFYYSGHNIRNKRVYKYLFISNRIYNKLFTYFSFADFSCGFTYLDAQKKISNFPYVHLSHLYGEKIRSNDYLIKVSALLQFEPYIKRPVIFTA